MNPFIHPLADVQSNSIGEGTRIWQYCVILPKARIGRDCNLNAHTFVENDVLIGDNVTLKCGVFLWDGVRVGDNVFIGPNVSFCNDKYPRAGVHDERRKLLPTTIGNGVSIGSGVVILPGIEIGANVVVAGRLFV